MYTDCFAITVALPSHTFFPLELNRLALDADLCTLSAKSASMFSNNVTLYVTLCYKIGFKCT